MPPNRRIRDRHAAVPLGPVRTTLPAVLGGRPAFPDGLPLVRPRLSDVPAVARRIEAVLDSGMLTNGPVVRQLEDTVADYLGVRHVVAVSSCTSGLMLVLQACGMSGRVVLPSFTFSASAHVIVWAGGQPVFADCDPATLTLDPRAAKAALDGASGILGTHLYGTPCDVERLQALADAAGVPLVYDAAHALGSRRGGTPIGAFGAAEVFSLSPTKVTVAGEGGLIATNDDALADTCRIGRNYGNPGDYDCAFPGLNARMSELHAAVALGSFADLDDRVARRNALVRRFKAAVAGLPGLHFPTVASGDTSTYKDLTLLLEPEEFGLGAAQVQTALRAEGIDSRRYFSPPVHRQKAYADAPTRALPVTEWAAERILSPPLWSQMTDDQVERLAAAVTRLHDHAPAVVEALR